MRKETLLCFDVYVRRVRACASRTTRRDDASEAGVKAWDNIHVPPRFGVRVRVRVRVRVSD